MSYFRNVWKCEHGDLIPCELIGSLYNPARYAFIVAGAYLSEKVVHNNRHGDDFLGGG